MFALGEKKDRVILHCDCNSFFASVELLKYPELKDKPVAVSGSVDDRRGIILAKNEEAKKYRVQTAETVWQARRKCPELILLPPHHKEYRKYSKIINGIYEQYTDRVEAFGIDESWLDITGSWPLFGSSPEKVADKIRNQIKQQTGLTVSVGVSFNKIFAKLGSDYKKPDATTVISRDNYREIVWPLPVGNLLFVGKKAAASLKELDISTIGDLAGAKPELLEQVLGKQGTQLYRYATGQDDAEVMQAGEKEPIKSVGNGMTFRRSLVGRQDIHAGAGALADEVAGRLRRYKLYATNIQVIIKDDNLKSISRQKPLPYASNLAKDIAEAANELVEKNWPMDKPIRMLTITAQNLTDVPLASQMSLFEEPVSLNSKRQSLETSMDKIREKFGYGSITSANILHNDIGIHVDGFEEEEETEDVDFPHTD